MSRSSRSSPHRRTRYFLAATATFALSACADTTATAPSKTIEPTSASFGQAQEFNDPRHVFHTKQWYANDALQNAGGNGNGRGNGGPPTSSGTGIYYHGGPVLQAETKVAAIYWASTPIYVAGPAVGTSGPGSADASLIGYFISNLGGSSRFNINSTYTDGAGRAIINKVTYTQYWANGTNAPTGTESVSGSQMLAMLESGFNNGSLSYDGNTLYAIFTKGQVNLGGGFGTQYCAYHTHGTVTVGGVARNVLYAAMPYNYAYPGACTAGTAPANGTLDPGADYEVNTLAHEIEEATTDPMANAWFDNRGFENADKCAWTWGAGYTSAAGGVANVRVGAKDFLVQQNWVNAGSGGCAKSYP